MRLIERRENPPTLANGGVVSKKRSEDWPVWIRPALQGVAYWIGHRRCLYRHYPLAEAALVAEICNLIHANLPDDLVLNCEVRYETLLRGKAHPDELSQKARADLVVSKKGPKGTEPSPQFIIEVKRASASNKQIDTDLRRLAAVCKSHGEVRAFMFLISEASRPKRFVTERGMALKRKRSIPDSEWFYQVRRTWKAAHAFEKRDRAQYACLVEVFAS